MMPVMEQQRIKPVAERWHFAGVVQCQPVTDHGWRLVGVERDVARTVNPLPDAPQLIIDIVANDSPSRELAELATLALRDVVLHRRAESGDDWWLEAAGKRWLLPTVRVFVHRDIGGPALAAIPPRRVPWGKRLFWSTLLALLRTETGRRWVRRRYGV